MPALVSLENISKAFGAIHALSSVQMKIFSGEVHALVGENGAGKSTLVKILSGIFPPDQGIIRVHGKACRFSSPQDAWKHGIATLHQEVTMFDELTITENIFIGHPKRFSTPILRSLLDWKSMYQEAEKLLREIDMELDPRTKLRDLSLAQKQMLEMARALSHRAELFILDEPTSSLSQKEIQKLYTLMDRLKSQKKSIVFISHKFEEIFRVADRYTVLRDGVFVGEGKISETQQKKLVSLMVGRTLDQVFPKVQVSMGQPIFRVQNLSREGEFENINFQLHHREILGFYGLIGSGRSEVMQSIVGIRKLHKGQIFFSSLSKKAPKKNPKELSTKLDKPGSSNGSTRQDSTKFDSIESIRLEEQQNIHNPTEAIQNHIVYVPEDRQNQGAILPLSIQENITLPSLDRILKNWFLSKPRELSLTQKYSELFRIKSSGPEQKVSQLSGGNQQKVVLAKWLATEPRVVILDEPTRGIDIATKASVHELMGQMVQEGLSVILVSSELHEVMSMSDRILVMREGRIQKEFQAKDANPEAILSCALGLE